MLAQPLLMQHWLEPFRSEIESVPDTDVIAQASLLWKIIYQVVAQFRRSHPEFIIMRHEDLSLNPMDGFGELFARLGLAFNPKAQRAVRDSSKPANPAELPEGSEHAYHLDSRANLTRWKERLTPPEIERIKEITGETAADFYPELEWD
jgi:hypothetical protein